ncbi:MAG: hypothetical protein ACLRFR_03580 [Clostridia bacterium]|nr:hypothetical protein [Clostridia bacterium]
MNVMSSYAGAATTVALSANGDLQPYYMGIDVSSVPVPLVALGVTVTYVAAVFIGLKLLERFF